jgi:hypothetical protein
VRADYLGKICQHTGQFGMVAVMNLTLAAARNEKATSEGG